MASPSESDTGGGSAESSVPTLTASPATAVAGSTPISTTTTHDKRPTSYPPMTTHWSTPDSCTWTYDINQTFNIGTTGPIAWLDLEPDVDASTVSCYPDGMFYGGRTGTFSPGTCPNGWTTVSVRRNTNEPKSLATTTAVCCSSEYSLDGSICKREIPTALAVPIVYNTTDGTHNVLTKETLTLTSATLAVWTINALFQEVDKEILGLTDEDEIRTIDQSDKGGLSLGARIGIGIGATIGAFLALGVVLWLLCRRRKRANRERSQAAMAEDARLSAIIKKGQGSEHSAPAYGFEQKTSIEGTGRGREPDEEIDALKAEREAIERRIEELERNA